MTKYSIPLLVLVFVCSCHLQKHPDSNKDTVPVSLELTSDSGYISKKEGLRFLMSQSLTDSSGYNWKSLGENDTIGKYYKLPDNSGHMVCLMTTDTVIGQWYNYLFEIKAVGGVKRISSQQRYLHNTFPCCWSNFYEGFRKVGNFFYLKTCESCPSCCWGMFYLFKKLSPQDSLVPIRESYYASFFGKTQILRSNIAIDTTGLHVDYFIDILGANALSKKIVIEYKFENCHWYAQDSTNLKELDFDKY